MLIVNENLSPEFNLACEEYFLTQKSGAYVLLWRNSRSVIIGRNQNAYAELDFDYIRRNDIAVIRRLTGGGAVFHDAGNLNFSFIFDGTGLADFREVLSPVLSFLTAAGINAEFSGRNDILADGKKISGCAQANSCGRTLVHGTLLFAADISMLASALKPNPLKLISKGIGSVRSRVGNIGDMLPEKITVLQFRDLLAEYFTDKMVCERRTLTENDAEKIQLLAADKYSAFEWNIGQSPSWSMEKTGSICSGFITFAFSVKNGVFSEMHIYGDFFAVSEIEAINESFKGCAFSPQAVLILLRSLQTEKIIPGLTPQTAVDIIFFRAQ